MVHIYIVHILVRKDMQRDCTQDRNVPSMTLNRQPPNAQGTIYFLKVFMSPFDLNYHLVRIEECPRFLYRSWFRDCRIRYTSYTCPVPDPVSGPTRWCVTVRILAETIYAGLCAECAE